MEMKAQRKMWRKEKWKFLQKKKNWFYFLRKIQIWFPMEKSDHFKIRPSCNHKSDGISRVFARPSTIKIRLCTTRPHRRLNLIQFFFFYFTICCCCCRAPFSVMYKCGSFFMKSFILECMESPSSWAIPRIKQRKKTASKKKVTNNDPAYTRNEIGKKKKKMMTRNEPFNNNNIKEKKNKK